MLNETLKRKNLPMANFQFRTGSDVTVLAQKTFKQTLVATLKSIQTGDWEKDEDGYPYFEEYSTEIPVTYGSLDRYQRRKGSDRVSLQIGLFYPDNINRSDLFKSSPAKSAAKILKGDNYIEYFNAVNNKAIYSSYKIDAGEGDDIIDFSGSQGGVSLNGGKGNDILMFDTVERTDYVTNPRLTGGKGADVFMNLGGYATITDYEPGVDSLSSVGHWRNRIKSKAVTDWRAHWRESSKGKIVDGDLVIFERKSMEPVYLLEGITNIKDVTFVNPETVF